MSSGNAADAQRGTRLYCPREVTQLVGQMRSNESWLFFMFWNEMPEDANAPSSDNTEPSRRASLFRKDVMRVEHAVRGAGRLLSRMLHLSNPLEPDPEVEEVKAALDSLRSAARNAGDAVGRACATQEQCLLQFMRLGRARVSVAYVFLNQKDDEELMQQLTALMRSENSGYAAAHFAQSESDALSQFPFARAGYTEPYPFLCVVNAGSRHSTSKQRIQLEWHVLDARRVFWGPANGVASHSVIDWETLPPLGRQARAEFAIERLFRWCFSTVYDEALSHREDRPGDRGAALHAENRRAQASLEMSSVSAAWAELARGWSDDARSGVYFEYDLAQ